MTKLDFEFAFQKIHPGFKKVQERQISEILQNCLELHLPVDSLQHFKGTQHYSWISVLFAAKLTPLY